MAKMGRPPVARTVLACATCGGEVRRYPSEVRRLKTSRVFCSKECFLAAGGLKPKTGHMKPCAQCGADMWETPSTPRTCCSYACHNAAQTKTKVTRTCETCGKTFVLSRTQVANSRWGRFCSYECLGVSKRKRPLGRMHNGKPALLDKYGYVKVWEPERRAGQLSKYMAEHRLVVEKILGRPLEANEHVDHINGVKDDNRPENLRIVDPNTHAKITAATMAERRLAMVADLAELAEYRRRFGSL